VRPSSSGETLLSRPAVGTEWECPQSRSPACRRDVPERNASAGRLAPRRDPGCSNRTSASPECSRAGRRCRPEPRVSLLPAARACARGAGKPAPAGKLRRGRDRVQGSTMPRLRGRPSPAPTASGPPNCPRPAGPRSHPPQASVDASAETGKQPREQGPYSCGQLGLAFSPAHAAKRRLGAAQGPAY
jgi:hypothetical protein